MSENDLFSDLFKLRNAVNLKKNPLQKKWKFLGGGGRSTNDPLEGKFEGVGVKTKEPSMGGVWIFSGTTQYDTCYFFGEGVQYLNSEKMLTVTYK